MVDINKKTIAYHHICNVFDEYVASLQPACRPGCAVCCTINVTMTALEGYLIAETLAQTGHADVLESLEHHPSRQRFIPQYTLNQLAEMIAREESVPEEIIDPEWGSCPLLNENNCPIYDVRPFACRCLVSEKKCGDGGYALMSPSTVAVNQVMLQYIEHVDLQGFTGNMTDVLRYMRSAENRRRYRDGLLPDNRYPFIRNHPARHLLIEPACKETIAPLLAALNKGEF